MKYIIAGIILYGLFFLICYLGTGGDKKNMKSFHSYPDEVQIKIRLNNDLSKMIPAKPSYLKSFLSNLTVFTIIFIVIGFLLSLSEFIPTFIYLLILGEGLNLFDLIIIDFCWWSKTKRTHFGAIIDDKDYHGIRKHWLSFIKGIPVFACAALIAAVAINKIF
ncbi:ABC transporter permease [Clostridium sp. UBA1652]|uniref:ABC transporter permease n=1 Tax=Clostridium sp. UBA1652 TaxID=1946348 RepID=UPI00257C0F11|nr:ABC transporter permease [Clostridium sp. UBA1652]